MKTTSKHVICIISLILIFQSITQIVSLRGYDEKEALLCKNTIPRNSDDCLKGNEFKTLVCCSVTMEIPFEGNICMPMGKAEKGTNGKFERPLPKQLNIKGTFTCAAGFLKMNLGNLFLLLIFLFIYML